MRQARGSLVLLMVFVACAAGEPQDDEARLAHALGQLRRGAYDSAAAALAELATSRDSTIAVSARRHHVRALSERGRYDEAEALARRYGGTELLVPLGDLLRTRGRLAPAESESANTQNRHARRLERSFRSHIGALLER